MASIRKIYTIFCLTFAACFILLWMTGFSNSSNMLQQNQAPVVTLLKPQHRDFITPGSSLRYEISVADKEDGNSKYDEINPKEVLLEVRMFTNKIKGADFARQVTQADEPGLAVIRVSNCFSCHNFNSKAMGPSFDEIQRKYPSAKKNVDTLTKRILAGSTGIWGKEKMPSHPELTPEQVKNTVKWILKNSNKLDVNYFIGLSGVIPGTYLTVPGTYVFTASYIDHGFKGDATKQRLKGEDRVLVNTGL